MKINWFRFWRRRFENGAGRTILNGEVTITPINGQPVFRIDSFDRWEQKSETSKSTAPAWLAGFALLIWLFHPNSVQAEALTPSVIHQRTNAARQAAGLPTLRLDDRLMQAALAKAEDMRRLEYFNHTSPSGTKLGNWMSAAGYQFTQAGENLGMNYTGAEQLMAAWMQSSTHRANILGSQYTDLGAAVVPGNFQGEPGIYIVQMFGSQRARTTAPLQTQTTWPKKTEIQSPAPPAEPRVPSLVQNNGVPMPNLSFTYTELDPKWVGSRPDPRVAGTQAQIVLIGAGSSSPSSPLPYLIVIATSLQFLLVLLYGLWKPDAHRPLVITPSRKLSPGQ